MQGAEIKNEGSVRKYMTKFEIDEQRSSLHIMTQRLSLTPKYTTTRILFATFVLVQNTHKKGLKTFAFNPF